MNISQSLDYVLWSTGWMSWNILLALIPVALAQTLKYQKSRLVEACTLTVWLLFLPNTLYLITDGMYVFSEEFGNMHLIGMVLGVLLYAIIVAAAPYTYYWSVKPVISKYISSLGKPSLLFVQIILLPFSFIVSLGITMGRFARTNSWHVITNPSRVINDILYSLFSQDTALFILSFFAGVFLINLLIIRRFVR